MNNDPGTQNEKPNEAYNAWQNMADEVKNNEAKEQEPKVEKQRRSSMEKECLTYKLKEAKGFKEAWDEVYFADLVAERLKTQKIENPVQWDSFKEDVNPQDGKYYLSRYINEDVRDYYNNNCEDTGHVDWFSAGPTYVEDNQENQKRNYKRGIGIYALEFDSLEDAAIYAEKAWDEAQRIFDAWEFMWESGDINFGYSPLLSDLKYNADLSGNYEQMLFDVRNSDGEVVYETIMANNTYAQEEAKE